jgi:hypothetical protein
MGKRLNRPKRTDPPAGAGGRGHLEIPSIEISSADPPEGGGRGNLVLPAIGGGGGESVADESNWAMHDLPPGKSVGVGTLTLPNEGTNTSQEPQPEPVIAEHTREVLISKTEELSRLCRENWEKASLSQDELTTVVTHLEAVRQLLLAPAPEISIVIQVLQAPVKIIKKMPDLVTYFLGVITEINLVIGELEKLGVDVTALRELIKQLLSNFD